MNLARDYLMPLTLALLLHAGVAAALLRGWQVGIDRSRPVEPRAIEAKLLVLNRPVPKLVSAQPKPDPLPNPAPPAKPKPKPPPPKPRAEQPPPRDLEAERRAQQEAEQQARLRKLAARATAQALEAEAGNLDEGADEATMGYVDGIYRAIVAQWSRPPSARNDMQARLLVELVPTGELLTVTLLESSGNPAFDRSAEVAVRKVGRFDVPQESGLFEAEFRRFKLLFKPQDLLR